jgi:hypothetical protein
MHHGAGTRGAGCCDGEDNAAVAISQAIAYRCAGDLFLLTLRRYPPRISAGAPFSSLRGAQSLPEADVIQQTEFRAGSAPDAPLWRITESQKNDRCTAIATALWVDGRLAGSGITARFDLALNAVRNSPLPAVVAVVSHTGQSWAARPGRALGHFLEETASLSDLAGRFVAAPGDR